MDVGNLSLGDFGASEEDESASVAAPRAGVEEAVPAEEEGEDGVRVWWGRRRMYSISFIFSLMHFLSGSAA